MTRIDVRDVVSIRGPFGRIPKKIVVHTGQLRFFRLLRVLYRPKEWDFVKLYATEREENLVVIEDILRAEVYHPCT